jgi:small subunit ribosomal protein S2
MYLKLIVYKLYAKIKMENLTPKQTLKKMIYAGMHFGHQAKNWNPKMAPYIYTERNGIHIIDLVQTYQHFQEVCSFLTESASKNKTFLFVGTKKQSSRLIAKAAIRCNSFFVNQRWLGGMLTNWETIIKSINKLIHLEKQEKNGEFLNYPKKEAAKLLKEKERLEKYLGGLKTMKKIPDVVIIIGQNEETHAVYECRKLGIANVTILDTDCDPSVADFFIPANDDSIASLQFLLTGFIDSIQKGQALAEKKSKTISKKL